MAKLLCNPERLAKAKAELNQALDKDEQFDELKLFMLPYIRVVVKETFLLHPVVPLLVPHKLEDGIELRGFLVSKNVKILVNVWAIWRDSRIWNNLNKFLLERFLDYKIDVKEHDFELILFMLEEGFALVYHWLLGLCTLCWHLFKCNHDWKPANRMKAEVMDMNEKYGAAFA